MVPHPAVQLIPDTGNLPVVAGRPNTVANALVMCWPEVGEVIVRVGLVTSRKLACNIRFDTIKNCTVGPLVMMLSGRLVPPVQLVKTKPVPGVAAME